MEIAILYVIRLYCPEGSYTDPGRGERSRELCADSLLGAGFRQGDNFGQIHERYMTEIRHRREENSLSGSIAEVPQAAPTESLDMLRMFHTCVTEQGENPALYYFDRNISYRELDAQSDALSCWLLGRGVVEGDRVAIILQNVPQFVMMTVAAWKIGAIPLPINPMYRVTELSRILADAEPKVALCFSGQVSEVLADRAFTECVLRLDRAPRRPHS
jgi:non-ribosomal peptide synthetase component F